MLPCPEHRDTGTQAAHLCSGGCARAASRESGTGCRTSGSGGGFPEQGGGSPLSGATSPRGIGKSGQAGSAGLLGLQDSLQKPPGLRQDSPLELGVPWEEGSIDLRSPRAWGSG